mgnify:CR=1 FL=1
MTRQAWRTFRRRKAIRLITTLPQSIVLQLDNLISFPLALCFPVFLLLGDIFSEDNLEYEHIYMRVGDVQTFKHSPIREQGDMTPTLFNFE